MLNIYLIHPEFIHEFFQKLLQSLLLNDSPCFSYLAVNK